MLEAQAATAIGHENIVDISDFGKLPDGSVYFAMEHLEGLALTDLVKKGGSVPLRTALEIVRQMASALGAAHERGIVHRDLKPDNVFLIRRGGIDHFVKVLDFGIAKVGGASSKLTKTGMVFGTPHYMSPEQAAGQSVDLRTDIYALGVIMYEMFTGKVPFDADTFMGILTKHMFETPAPPTEVGSRALGAIEPVILKALAKKPEHRYQTMGDLIADLDAISSGGSVDLGGEAGISPPDNLADALEPPSRTEMGIAMSPRPSLPGSRTPIYVAVGAGLAIFFAVVIGAIFAFGSSEADEPETPVVAQPPTEPPEPPEPPAPTEPVAPESPATIEIQSTPAGAQVRIGGAIIGNTPVTIPRPAEGESLDVRVRLRGHETTSLEVTSESDEVVAVELVEEEQEAPARPVRPTMRATMTTSESPMMGPPAVTMGSMRSISSEVVDPWAM
jgi:serine/threonine-protein kinase